MHPVGILKIFDSFESMLRSQPLTRDRDVISNTVPPGKRLPIGKVVIGALQLLIEHSHDRVKINRDETASRFEDSADSPRPYLQIGEPADSPVRAKGHIKALLPPGGLLKPVVDIHALPLCGYPRILGELASEINGGIADIHSCHDSAQSGH